MDIREEHSDVRDELGASEIFRVAIGDEESHALSVVLGSASKIQGRRPRVRTKNLVAVLAERSPQGTLDRACQRGLPVHDEQHTMRGPLSLPAAARDR